MRWAEVPRLQSISTDAVRAGVKDSVLVATDWQVHLLTNMDRGR